jgi:hypothetical protein
MITTLDVLKSSLYELGFQTDICGSYDGHNIARYVNSYKNPSSDIYFLRIPSSSRNDFLEPNIACFGSLFSLKVHSSVKQIANRKRRS